MGCIQSTGKGADLQPCSTPQLTYSSVGPHHSQKQQPEGAQDHAHAMDVEPALDGSTDSSGGLYMSQQQPCLQPTGDSAATQQQQQQQQQTDASPPLQLPPGGNRCVTPDAAQQPAGNSGNSSEASPPGNPIMVVWREPDAPPDEESRHANLCSYNILDTEPEEAYDRITALCKSLFKVPIAMITFVDRERVWLKSLTGLSGLTQVDRRASLCAWTLLSKFPEAMVVPNLLEDVRFREYPVVKGWPHARFYAASPLVTSDGKRLGTLCILDTQPRPFSAENASLLAQLASMVMREVERKRAMNEVLCSAALRQGGDNISQDRQGVMLVDVCSPKWPILLVNDTWQRAVGIGQQMVCGAHFWDLFERPVVNQMNAVLLACEQQRNFELRVPVSPAAAAAGLTHSTSQHMQPAPGLSHSGHLEGFSSAGGIAEAAAAYTPHPGAFSGSCVQPPASFSMDSASSSACSSRLASSMLLQQQLAFQQHGSGSGSNQLLPPVACQGRPSVGRMSVGSAGGGLKLGSVRFQFRSAAGANPLCSAAAISIPPMLLHSKPADHIYYWATVDLAPEDSGVLTGSMVLRQGPLALSGASSEMAGSGSGDYGGGSSEPATPPKTTFNLLPEENPFSDITIGILLGWGSYGRVHRGYWNGTLVAVKVLEQIAGDVNPRTTLEPLLHHRLAHPNVVKMYDISTQEVDVCEDGRPLQEVWMVLEFCNRGTLSEAIARGSLLLAGPSGPVPGAVNIHRVVRTASDIAAAMSYLHGQNVLHGDLNGNNILLVGANPRPQDDRDFLAKVADFGLSRMLSPDNDKIITRTHGTITHMAPEVIVESTHSKAADVYSVGVVLWEMLTAKRAYQGMHYAQIVHSITTGQPLDVPENVPPVLRQLLQDCLSKRPQDRPTFPNMVERLQQLDLQQLTDTLPAATAAAAAPQAPAS